MNEVLIAFAAAVLAAIALSAEPGTPSERTVGRIAQAAPPAVELGRPSADDQEAEAADDRDDDDDDRPGADDDRDDD
jgi:hypothetical protein